MTDTPTPFSPFTPSPPPVPMFEGEVGGKKPRNPAKRRGKNPAKRRGKNPAKRRGKPARKPRASKAPALVTGSEITARQEAAKRGEAPTRRRAARKPRPTMIPIGILPALGGLAEAETSLLMSLIGNMQDVPKKSRLKIVAALGRVFA